MENKEGPNKEYYKHREKTKKSPAKDYYKHSGKQRRAQTNSIINTEENEEEPCQRVL